MAAKACPPPSAGAGEQAFCPAISAFHIAKPHGSRPARHGAFLSSVSELRGKTALRRWARAMCVPLQDLPAACPHAVNGQFAPQAAPAFGRRPPAASGHLTPQSRRALCCQTGAAIQENHPFNGSASLSAHGLTARRAFGSGQTSNIPAQGRAAARKHRPRKTVFAHSLFGFPRQPQRAPAESFPALHQKLPLTGGRAALARRLWRKGVQKSPASLMDCRAFCVHQAPKSVGQN